MRNKPGVMIYFDIMHAIRRMTYEEAGQLFLAIMDYAENQTLPELPEKLELVWSLIRPRLDIDDQRYYEISSQKQYAAYVRWQKRANEAYLSYEEWVMNPLLTSKVDTSLIS